MSHVHPNAKNKYRHAFVCDKCGAVAGDSQDEGEALREARETAKREGWNWEHPGWQLACPNCQVKDGGK